tara:strand:- start:1153 stop:1926 length:774 start_codon:yes stop_codon:yes gene_type:complete
MKIKDIVNHRATTLIVIALFLLLVGKIVYNQFSNLKTDLRISNQNVKSLSDTIRVTKNKVGDLEYSKQILVATRANLKDLNQELADELKKEKGKVFELTKYVVNVKQNTDTVQIQNNLIQYPNGVNALSWTYEKNYDKDNYRSIAGTSKFSIDSLGVIKPLETSIFKDEINFSVVQGLRKIDGKIEMFARSDYPGFKISELNSAIIDPKTHPVLKEFTTKKRFGFGLYGGYGATVINSTVNVGPQVGLGLTYDIFQF